MKRVQPLFWKKMMKGKVRMNQMKDKAADLKQGEIRDKQETTITCFIDESMSETPPSRPSKNCAVVKR